MPDKCFVPGCTSGYKSNPDTRVAKFHPPKGKLEEWSRAIPRAMATLKYKDVVCEKHFDTDEILSKHIIEFSDGSKIEEERKKKALKDGAVPHIFPNFPKYLTSRKSHRMSPKKRYTLDKTSSRTLAEASTHILQKTKSLFDRLNPTSLPTPIDEALNHVSTIALPENWTYLQDTSKITLAHSPTGDVLNIDKSISFPKQKKEQASQIQNPTVYFNEKELDIKKEIRTKEDLEKFLKQVHRMKPCPGTGIDDEKDSPCLQIISHQFMSLTVRCKFCQRERKRLCRVINRRQVRKTNKQKKDKAKRDKTYRMKKQIISLRKEIRCLKDEMSKMDEEAAQKVLDTISEEKHKEVVKAIIMASKCKTTKNRRYSNEWMYECIFMRIKSPSLYRKMLRDNLLPLPSFRTIQRFMQKLKPQFGFHENTFRLMGQKSEYFAEEERHGVLMADEMATEENIEFNKSTGQVHGMVDLGSASPPDADSTLGDHGLVLLFQPFKGQWFQTIGAFCSRGAAKGPELEKLITEAIILLYTYNYYVDVVTTDGGSWNRNMWTLFGIKENQVSCVNPAEGGKDIEENLDEKQGDQHGKDPGKDEKERRLWFISDFPHLVKAIWSRVRTSGTLQTPDGEVKLQHWRVLAETDNERFTHINVCHKLTMDHVEPSNWQTMNVKMAFQFFSDDVAGGMEHYRDVEGVNELQDCHATVLFIRKVATLRKAMNAENVWDSLRDEDDNTSKEAIKSFLEFLELWKKKCQSLPTG